MHRTALAKFLALSLALAAMAAPAQACGYEDPDTVAIGALNFSFPNALYVGAAIWQAQQDHLLPKNDPADPLTNTTQVQSRSAQWSALLLLNQLHKRLTTLPHDTSIALVFLRTMLWTRYVDAGERVAMLTHTAGSESDDVVIISEPVVIRALLDGHLTLDAAIDRGLMRLYANDAALTRARDWLARSLESTPL